MENNDPINIEYTRIVMNIGDEELNEIDKRAFVAEVEAVKDELTFFADKLAEHFGPEAVAAALHLVWDDYDSVVNGAVGDDE